MSTTMLPVGKAGSTDDYFGVMPELLPDHFEVIDGRIVETPYMSDYSEEVASRLNERAVIHLAGNPLGTSGIERLFHIPQKDDEGRNRRPDWSYVSYQRWPKDRPYKLRGSARDVVPDIAAEVVSPGDLADDLIAKIREYLRGGVCLAWIVYPLAQEIHAYWPGSNTIRVYSAADELDTGDILPGFRTSVAGLFPPLEPPTPPPPPNTAS